MKFIEKIKKYFSFNTSPCYYIYETKKHKAYFFMNDSLNKYEKTINETSLYNTEIKTIEQGKKLFFRFLKYKSIYELYISELKKRYYGERFINNIIKDEFLTPFYSLYKGIKDKDKRLLFIKKEKEWIDFLKSIKYINF